MRVGGRFVVVRAIPRADVFVLVPQLALKLHPDKNAAPSAAEAFQRTMACIAHGWMLRGSNVLGMMCARRLWRLCL